MPQIKKILIANRGEIALRIIRTCKDLDIRSVAVYSEADRLSPHVLHADEAYCIGPPPAVQSYLSMDKLIQVAHKAEVGAIHPGYGFLAENPEFSARLDKEKLTFIGPREKSIRLMGSKTESRRLMKNAGVPVVPGTEKPVQSLEEAKKVIDKIGGYPVLIKAAAGGGGKGMRVVESQAALERALSAGKSEAQKAFGDATVYIEKYLASAKHIEMQIFSDSHGNSIHLGERDCSIQRRHQKVIEESPSPVLTPEKRQQMGEIAIQASRACDYLGAGTVEFLYNENGEFYFLEMNTRLQVEHPVTEMVLGLDLVQLQIRVAEGETLPLQQEDIVPRGHSIECRIYAEDPSNNFMPSTGKITNLNIPAGPGIRVDNGVEANSQISMFYDPLVGKLISWGADREHAINRMKRALQEYNISGIQTTIPFCLQVLDHPQYITGKYDTNFVANHLEEMKTKIDSDEKIAALAALAISHLRERESSLQRGLNVDGRVNKTKSQWKLRGKSLSE